MRRLILAFSLTLITMLLVASPATAGRRWCARDPIVSLNGQTVQVWVAVPQEYMSSVNGPVDVTFETPAGVSRSVILTDDGFNGHGEVVNFIDDPTRTVNPTGSFTVRIGVAVPIDQTLTQTWKKDLHVPIQVTVIEGGTTTVFQGWHTGSWFTISVDNGE